MDQMAYDSDCCVNRRTSNSDHRLSGIHLALGSINRFNGRFPTIHSIFKSDTGTIPDTHPRGCTEGHTDSHTSLDTVTKS